MRSHLARFFKGCGHRSGLENRGTSSQESGTYFPHPVPHERAKRVGGANKHAVIRICYVPYPLYSLAVGPLRTPISRAAPEGGYSDGSDPP